MLKTKFILFCCFFPFVLCAKVWVYPGPGEDTAPSPYFTVKILQDGQEFESFVNFSKADFGNSERSSSWTTFSFIDKIELEIVMPGKQINNCIIRPKSDSIAYRTEGNKINLELDKPRKLAIEINGDKSNVLFIFADPPEENIPKETEPGVLYYKPGVHDVGLLDLSDTVKQIYIAGGAIVYGAFRNKNKGSSFRMHGRGILSAEKFAETGSGIVDFKGSGLNVLVEGIMFLNGPCAGIDLKQSYTTIRNCKFLGWQSGTDGVECGAHGLVEDCFFRCNGDALKIYANHFVAQNCVFWQNESGAPFQLGWNQDQNNNNFRISDCDILHIEHATEAHNAAVFSAVHGGSGQLSNYLFENIRIEENAYRLFKLTLRSSKYDDKPGFGSISNVHFKNVTLEGQCLMANEIWGYNQAHSISDVTFENLNIGGTKIDNAKAGNFKINLNTTAGIVFK